MICIYLQKLTIILYLFAKIGNVLLDMDHELPISAKLDNLLVVAKIDDDLLLLAKIDHALPVMGKS
jgi:hypothetical protein